MEEASQGQIRTAQRRGREDLDRSGHQTWLEDQHEHHAMGLHGPRADSPERQAMPALQRARIDLDAALKAFAAAGGNIKRSRSRPRALGEPK